MRVVAWALAGAIGVGLVGQVGSAAAQEAAPVEGVAADVVKLKDGAFYRGTVMELVPGDHVDLRLPSGQTKRFAMTDVAYAGPAEGAPSTPPPLPAPPATPAPPKPAPPARSDGMKVRFEVTPPEAAFFVEAEHTTNASGTAVVVEHDLKLVCSNGSSCDGVMAPGTYHMGMSLKGSKVVEPEDPVTVSAPSTVQGTFNSRKWVRIGGWVTMGAGLTATWMMLWGSVFVKDACGQLDANDNWVYSNCNEGLIHGLVDWGIVAGVVGTAVGLALVLQRDSVEITLAPLDAGQPIFAPSSRREGGPAQSTVRAPGFGLVGRF